VEKSIDTTEVNECTVLSKVLNDTWEYFAFSDALKSCTLQCFTLLLKKSTTGKYDVSATLVELDDFELELFAEKLVEVTNRS
jgi:hypothetical protein